MAPHVQAAARAPTPTSSLVAPRRSGSVRGPRRDCPARAQAETHSSNGAVPAPPPGDDASAWETSSIPEYMQQAAGESEELCESWEAALRSAGGSAGVGDGPGDVIWRTIRREAEADAAQEPLLSSFLYASILSHDSFPRSLAFVLSNRLSDATFLSTELFEVFYSILRSKPAIVEAALADIAAVRERDPACLSYSQALLHFKGFHAIEAHRIAHELWCRGRRVMAAALQSRMSEVFAVDIHPAARFGKGILLDHGTGVVIGETAELGNNVSILQNVTLGGTGKAHGDRHPKISDNVLIGASASILGNIRVGKGAQVAAGSLVLKAVPPRTLVAGSPAKEIGTIKGNPALKMEQWCIDNQEMLRAQLDRDPFAEAKPKAKLGAAPGGGSSGADGGAGKGAQQAEEQQQAEQQRQQAQAPEVPALQTAEQRNGAMAPAAGQRAAAVEQQQAAPRHPPTPREAATAALPALPTVSAEPRPPQREEAGVDAVTSDRVAQEKWPAKKSSPPEYFI